MFVPGDRDPLLTVGDRTAAVAICADTGRPRHAAAAAERGADTYLASVFVIPSDFERDAARLAGYAKAHAMAVVCASYGSPTAGLPSAGRSTIWSPDGEVVARLGESGPGLALATSATWTGRCMVGSELP